MRVYYAAVDCCIELQSCSKSMVNLESGIDEDKSAWVVVILLTMDAQVTCGQIGFHMVSGVE